MHVIENPLRWNLKGAVFSPGKEVHSEAPATIIPFGKGVELDIGSIILGLHVHVDPKDPDQLIFLRENPAIYGPIIVIFNKQEHILAPEEPLAAKADRICVLMGTERRRQMIFLSQKALNDPSFLDSSG